VVEAGGRFGEAKLRIRVRGGSILVTFIWPFRRRREGSGLGGVRRSEACRVTQVQGRVAPEGFELPKGRR
jgi:hypothetical protein